VFFIGGKAITNLSKQAVVANWHGAVIYRALACNSQSNTAMLAPVGCKARQNADLRAFTRAESAVAPQFAPQLSHCSHRMTQGSA
jgi:hypothetical protein